MNYHGINMSNVKSANRASILYLLNNNGPMSRKDIAIALKLTPAAVTKICIDMLSENSIIECGVLDEDVRAGRKKILLSLNTDNIYALSVSIELNGCYIALCTLSGKEKCGEMIAPPKDETAESYLDNICDRCNSMIKKSSLPKEKIIGAGVSIVGAVDRQTGVTVGSYGIWKSGIRVKETFEKKLGLSVSVENNVKAFALAELIFDSENSKDNMLLVKWGPGVGSAIVISNEVFAGHGNATAEIGHYIVHPHGNQCRCGRKGCLETHVSSGAIVKRIKECYSQKETPELFRMTGGNADKITPQLIMENRDKLDKSVKDIIERRINRMARAVTNAATIIEPDQVMIFGYMFNETTAKSFIEYCKNYYNRFDESYIKISKLQNKINFIGSVAVVAKNQFFEK